MMVLSEVCDHRWNKGQIRIPEIRPIDCHEEHDQDDDFGRVMEIWFVLLHDANSKSRTSVLSMTDIKTG